MEKPDIIVVDVNNTPGQRGKANAKAKAAAAQQRTVSANRGSSRARTGGYDPMDNTPVGRSASPQPMDEYGEVGDLVECELCGRSFRRDRIEAHQRVCKKNKDGAAKRGVFRQSKVDRAQGMGAGGAFGLHGDPFQGRGADDGQKINYRADDEVELDKSTRTADGKYPCPTCGRLFSEDAARRHFPICKRITANQSVRMKFH